jgi:hypothetical protein
MIVPFMPGWFEHAYGNVPAVVNVRWKVPVVWSGEVCPEGKVTLCKAPVFCHVHVTVVFAGTVVEEGVN